MSISAMRRLAAFLLWSCVFLALLVAFDQLLLRLPPESPVPAFYRDFRQRLQELSRQRPAVHRPLPAESARPSAFPAPPSAPGYVYVDGEGNLQFADTLQQVPSRYRQEATPLQP